jgi:hypothetical protein
MAVAMVRFLKLKILVLLLAAVVVVLVAQAQMEFLMARLGTVVAQAVQAVQHMDTMAVLVAVAVHKPLVELAVLQALLLVSELEEQATQAMVLQD